MSVSHSQESPSGRVPGGSGCPSGAQYMVYEVLLPGLVGLCPLRIRVNAAACLKRKQEKVASK